MPSFRLHSALAEIPADQWNALAGAQPGVSHAFLTTLETSGCVAPRSGWAPRHAALWEGEHLIAAMPVRGATQPDVSSVARKAWDKPGWPPARAFH